MAPERRKKDKSDRKEKKAAEVTVPKPQKKEKGKQKKEKETPATMPESQQEDKALIPAPSTQDADADAATAVVAATPAGGQPGVIYIGGIVYGFFEHQLREYLSQFSRVTRLRLSRNPRTGASRHYAFAEFADAGAAEVVARAMDGYLLMGNILRCRVVDPAAVHPDVWKGANRRFKRVPWAKMAGRRLERAATESAWLRRAAKEERRRAARADKLKEIGYEFDGPALKAAEAVAAVEGAEAVGAIEAAPAGGEE